RDRGAARRVPQFGVTTEIADENYFVYAAHGRALYIVGALRFGDSLFRERSGIAVRIVLDDGVVRFARAIELFQIPQRLAFEIVRIRHTAAHRVIPNHFVEGFDRLVVLAVVDVRAADRKLRVRRLSRRGEVLEER